MITCYFQYFYCGLSPPTPCLQLSPKLEASIVSVGGFYLLVYFLHIFPPYLSVVGVKENNKAYYFNSLLACR